MALIIFFIVAVAVGVICPTWLTLVLCIADIVLPDPFPYADEVGLIISLIVKMKAQ